jgi:hypothetical protein
MIAPKFDYKWLYPIELHLDKNSKILIKEYFYLPIKLLCKLPGKSLFLVSGVTIGEIHIKIKLKIFFCSILQI